MNINININMNIKEKYNLEWLNNNRQYILFEATAGSIAYGTNDETSDQDVRGVFILPNDVLFYNERIEDISDEKNNFVYYEIGKFCKMLMNSSPTVFELLNMPDDCVHVCDPLFKEYFIDKRKTFFSKKMYKSFLEYSIGQIDKATGTDKKMNWKEKDMKRKSVFDFCYVPYKQGSMLLNEWLIKNNYTQEMCGLSKIPHMRDNYHLFIDKDLLYKGIYKNDKSNDVLLSSIKKNEVPLITMYFNKDGYSAHCKKYREYENWKEKHNPQRFVDVKNHGQKIDGKNMLHCMRLIQTVEDIVLKNDIIVRRDNKDELLAIKYGHVSLSAIIEKAKAELDRIKILFDESDLPDDIKDKERIIEYLIEIRKKRYGYGIL